MSQNAINRRNGRRKSKRLRLQRAAERQGRMIKAGYIDDPRSSQAPGPRFSFKPEGRIPNPYVPRYR